MLSKQELKVYKLIHLSNRQIAFELDLCDSTVKFHKTSIYKKLGVKGAWEIICKQQMQHVATAQKRSNNIQQQQQE